MRNGIKFSLGSGQPRNVRAWHGWMLLIDDALFLQPAVDQAPAKGKTEMKRNDHQSSLLLFRSRSNCTTLVHLSSLPSHFHFFSFFFTSSPLFWLFTFFRFGRHGHFLVV